MKTVNPKPRGANVGSEVPTLAPSPVLEFVLALARHRAHLDHENAKLTMPSSIDSESIDFEALSPHITIDGDAAVPTKESSDAQPRHQ